MRLSREEILVAYPIGMMQGVELDPGKCFDRAYVLGAVAALRASFKRAGGRVTRLEVKPHHGAPAILAIGERPLNAIELAAACIAEEGL